MPYTKASICSHCTCYLLYICCLVNSATRRLALNTQLCICSDYCSFALSMGTELEPSKGTREDHFKTYGLMTTIWKQHSRKWWINIWFVLKRLDHNLEVQLSVVKNCISQTNPAVLVMKISWLNPKKILPLSLNTHTKTFFSLDLGNKYPKWAVSWILSFWHEM